MIEPGEHYVMVNGKDLQQPNGCDREALHRSHAHLMGLQPNYPPAGGAESFYGISATAAKSLQRNVATTGAYGFNLNLNRGAQLPLDFNIDNDNIDKEDDEYYKLCASLPNKGAQYNPSQSMNSSGNYQTDMDLVDLGCYRNESKVVYRKSEKSSREMVKRDEMNIEVLKQVLSYMDLENLGMCRLVCKTWNEIVIPIYSKYTFTFGQFSSSVCDYHQRKKHAKDFYEIMKSSPIGLVQKVIVDYEFLTFQNVQNWFSKYGASLTFLKIQGPFTQAFVHKILMSCPNLEILEISNLSHPGSYYTAQQALLNLVLPTIPFKLKKLRLTRSETQNHYEWIDTQEFFVSAIISNSPNLESLTTSFGDKSNSFTNFVEKLALQKKITENLIEWEIGSHPSIIPVVRTLAPVTAIQFSDRLKRLKIKDVRDHKCGGSSGLTKILNKVASSLETLILGGEYFLQLQSNPYAYGYNIRSMEELQLPHMENLKTFENWSTDAFKLYSLFFLRKFPNLEKLVLGGGSAEDFTKMLMYGVEEIIKVPHLKLRELCFVQQILDSRALTVVSVGFPNLTSLSLAIGPGLSDMWGFKNVDRMISQVLAWVGMLKGIKKFGMTFLLPIHPDMLHAGIGKRFQDFQSLQELTLIGHANPVPLPKQEIHFHTLKYGIFMVKTLKTVRLQDIAMDISGARDLFELAKLRGVKLDLHSD